MGNELSMQSRAEVTRRYAKVYAKVSKKDKGRILGEVVGVTRWSRDNARRRLTAAAKRPPGGGRQVAKKPRKPRSPKYSYDTVKAVSYTHLRAHETGRNLVCRLLLEKKKTK